MILNKSDITSASNHEFYTMNPKIHTILYVNFNNIVRAKLLDTIWSHVYTHVHDQVWDNVKKLA